MSPVSVSITPPGLGVHTTTLKMNKLLNSSPCSFRVPENESDLAKKRLIRGHKQILAYLWSNTEDLGVQADMAELSSPDMTLISASKVLSSAVVTAVG